jgi:hypothetical protein
VQLSNEFSSFVRNSQLLWRHQNAAHNIIGAEFRLNCLRFLLVAPELRPAVVIDKLSMAQHVGLRGAGQDADDQLQYLQQHQPKLRSLQLSHLRFRWCHLSPLFERLNHLILVQCVISDGLLPDEVMFEGLLFTADYSRHLVIDDELFMCGAGEGGGAVTVELVATCHSNRQES